MVLAYARLVTALELNYIVGFSFDAQDRRIGALRANLNLWRTCDLYMRDIDALIGLVILAGVERDI